MRLGSDSNRDAKPRRLNAVSDLLVEDFVIVRESRTAHENNPHRLGASVLERVPMLAGYVYGIARADRTLLVANRHHSSTGHYVVNLFNLSMMMRSDCVAGRENLFG